MSAPPLSFQVLAVSHGAASDRPVARLAGRTREGSLVVVSVDGVRPFLYVKLQRGLLRPDGSPDEVALELLRSTLSEAVDARTRRRGGGQDRWIAKPVVVSAHDYHGYSQVGGCAP